MAQKREEARREIARVRRKRQDDLLQKEILLESSRAGKLLLKDKPFLVVACDEPYYLAVYRTIRAHEKRNGTWTDTCEKRFEEAVACWVDDPSV